MTPLFPRSGPGESSSPTTSRHACPVTYLFRFRGPRYPPRFVSRSLRSRRVGGDLPGRGHCSAGDPIAGVLSRGRERDLPGFPAVHPVPLPRSRTPAESTIPRLFVGLVDAAPASRTAKASACQLFRGSITRLQHLLPTLQEWCCHHPCKARFRLAGLPLPGGGRTLWIALKGFRSHFHSPFLDFSWRYRDELPPSHQPSPSTGRQLTAIKVACEGTTNEPSRSAAPMLRPAITPCRELGGMLHCSA